MDISFHSSLPQTGVSTTRERTILSSDPNDTSMCQHLYPLLPGLIILTSTGGKLPPNLLARPPEASTAGFQPVGSPRGDRMSQAEETLQAEGPATAKRA